MSRVKAEFTNDNHETLAGLLELPEQEPRAYALFAHCFTCSKDIAAASRITRALASRGIATLRFDFTGLGNSDGDFANTNFSSNVSDLFHAANFLADEYAAPTLLIGHSLGGAAVLAAASRMASVKAVATIGAPATAKHVEHLFSAQRQEIETAAQATVSIGGREFSIKKQLLEDLDQYAGTEHIRQLKTALLIMHAPNDVVVDIEQAAQIYTAARHPKSFVSLDSADHLLSKKEDSSYVAEVLSAWSAKYLPAPQSQGAEQGANALAVADGEVAVAELDHAFTQQVSTSQHQFLADEPTSIGGQNRGPNPYELLLAALGACTAMTIRMFAKRKNIAFDDVSVVLKHERVHADDCADCENHNGYIEKIAKELRFKGDLSDQERTRLVQIADRCPMHKTLHGDLVIETKLQDA